jgi:glycerol-3-phosphate acyltransferase PlsY
MLLITIAFLAYLLGSIPFGLLLVRLSGRGDLRRIGSGNIGATNVLRTGSKPLAALTVSLDAGKGAVAVLLAHPYGEGFAIAASCGAFLGHLFPVWLKFQGGKGVATALGVYLALAWPMGSGACLAWLVTALVFRYSSLAALTAMVTGSIIAWYLDLPGLVFLSLFIGGTVWIRHAENICRLLHGLEPKIGQKKAADAPAF